MALRNASSWERGVLLQETCVMPRLSDEDVNLHVENTKYMTFIQDALSLLGHTYMKKIYIEYKAQAKMGKVRVILKSISTYIYQFLFTHSPIYRRFILNSSSLNLNITNSMHTLSLERASCMREPFWMCLQVMTRNLSSMLLCRDIYSQPCNEEQGREYQYGLIIFEYHCNVYFRMGFRPHILHLYAVGWHISMDQYYYPM